MRPAAPMAADAAAIAVRSVLGLMSAQKGISTHEAGPEPDTQISKFLFEFASEQGV